MTKRVSDSAESRLTVSSSGSMPGMSSPPRLRLTTSAPCATAHSMPAMIPDSLPKPPSSRTLPFRIFAPGATPLYVPPALAPVPATVDATCVPWPDLSPVPEAEPLKSCSATTCPVRSGWAVSMPVSRTATLTPVPSYPAAQAVGAPICGTLLSRLALRLPSSHSFSTAVESVNSAALVRLSAAAGHGVPELGAALLHGAYRLAVDHRQRPADLRPGPGERGHRGRLLAPEGDDQRYVAAAGVVVAVRDQLGHVEQPGVQPALGQQQFGVTGHDLGVSVDHPDGERHLLPALGPRPRR